MTDEPGTPPPSGRFRTILLTFAGAMVVWRLWAGSVAGAWRDWVVLVSLHLVVWVFLKQERARQTATAAFVAFLLGLYLLGQLPHLRSVLGPGP